MDLISTLNEASSHMIDDLKKILSKDKRVKQVLQKSLDLEDIENKVEFFQTMKFFVLNNRNVLNFVETRDYVNNVDKRTLKRLRELRPLEFKQKDLDDLLEFVSNLFREHGHVERSGMSSSLRKELLSWVNADGRYFDLSRPAQRELLSLPNLRPTRPTLLYRGLLFSASDLRERKRYDGSLEVGQGLKFLRSIREGSRIVDLEWDRASSWSTSKEIAMQFARFGPATSNFAATMQWLDRSSKKKHIDGDLGFIVSTLAQPEDILIDVSRMVTAAHLKHGNENEYILKPGTYQCRVSVKMDQTGEIDPITSSEANESARAVLAAVKQFSSTWLKNVSWDHVKSDGWGFTDLDRLMRTKDLNAIQGLMSVDLKKEAVESFDELKKFYEDHVRDVSTADVEILLANKETSAVGKWIKDLRDMFNGDDRHPAFKTAENSKGRVKVHQMSGAQYREAAHSSMYNYVRDGTKGSRYTDSAVGRTMNDLARVFANIEYKDLHRTSGAVQKEALDSILDGFFKSLKIEKPADSEEALKVFQTKILAAERNAYIVSRMQHLREDLLEALQTSESR